jgi:uncharacterized protein
VSRFRIDRLTTCPAPLRHGDAVIAARCHLAATPLARLVGLLATPDLRPDEALWLPGCSAVHAFGLRAPIGCAFLDGDGRVLRIVDPLPPGRAAMVRRARHVVERGAGTWAGVAVGDRLVRIGIPATSDLSVPGGGRLPGAS